MQQAKIYTRETLADTETPVSAFLKLAHGRPDSILLESAETHDSIGRLSIIAFDPVDSLELLADRAVLKIGDSEPEIHPAESFFELIRRLGAFSTENGRDVPPVVGSLMGFIGYEAVRLIERLGEIKPGDLPVARLVRPSSYVIFDHQQRKLRIAVLAGNEADGRDKIRRIEEALDRPLPQREAGEFLEMAEPDEPHFLKAVKAAQEHIREGEIFQVVLADSFSGRTDVKPFDVYRRLRVNSPSPYMFFLDFGGCQLVGASPETLVKVSGSKVFIRPIAGTRRRSDDPAEDLALEEELKASAKEKAEHVMLVDLGRNDAGRVSRFGSVRVEPYMTVERYSHVMHLVSQVQGELKEGLDAVDAFKAAFPAGTLSGAPKVRAMQIIDELERLPRGPYGGAVGWFGAGNEMDTCIAIRMVVFEGETFSIPVGAGIVADSSPEMEFKEIAAKAGQSIAALQAAAGGRK